MLSFSVLWLLVEMLKAIDLLLSPSPVGAVPHRGATNWNGQSKRVRESGSISYICNVHEAINLNSVVGRHIEMLSAVFGGAFACIFFNCGAVRFSHARTLWYPCIRSDRQCPEMAIFHVRWRWDLTKRAEIKRNQRLPCFAPTCLFGSRRRRKIFHVLYGGI